MASSKIRVRAAVRTLDAHGRLVPLPADPEADARWTAAWATLESAGVHCEHRVKPGLVEALAEAVNACGGKSNG